MRKSLSLSFFSLGMVTAMALLLSRCSPIAPSTSKIAPNSSKALNISVVAARANVQKYIKMSMAEDDLKIQVDVLDGESLKDAAVKKICPNAKSIDSCSKDSALVFSATGEMKSEFSDFTSNGSMSLPLANFDAEKYISLNAVYFDLSIPAGDIQNMPDLKKLAATLSLATTKTARQNS